MLQSSNHRYHTTRPGMGKPNNNNNNNNNKMHTWGAVRSKAPQAVKVGLQAGKHARKQGKSSSYVGIHAGTLPPAQGPGMLCRVTRWWFLDSVFKPERAVSPGVGSCAWPSAALYSPHSVSSEQ